MSIETIVFVDDDLPGITRQRAGKGWRYLDATGARIANKAEVARLSAIGLPPAYRDCWFCPSPDGHIQATGYDDKGRKQYRYHLGFRAQQEAAKYDLCAHFGRALPLLRRRVASDLARATLSRDTAVAAVVRLLDLNHIRIGNETYARRNKSFGATTLRKRHASFAGGRMRLDFKAKSNKQRSVALSDRQLVRLIKRMQDLPGQHLFRWADPDGTSHAVTSGDVNGYIHETMGDDFSAKHFRTWGASTLAFETLVTAKRDITLKQMLEPVARDLGNTPAISRKSYVHPRLVALAKDGQSAFRDGLRLPRTTRYLSRYERGLVAFLETPDPAPTEADA